MLQVIKGKEYATVNVSMKDIKELEWYYFVAIAVGIGAIVAMIYLIMNTTDVLSRITNKAENVIQAID